MVTEAATDRGRTGYQAFHVAFASHRQIAGDRLVEARDRLMLALGLDHQIEVDTFANEYFALFVNHATQGRLFALTKRSGRCVALFLFVS